MEGKEQIYFWSVTLMEDWRDPQKIRRMYWYYQHKKPIKIMVFILLAAVIFYYFYSPRNITYADAFEKPHFSYYQLKITDGGGHAKVTSDPKKISSLLEKLHSQKLTKDYNLIPTSGWTYMLDFYVSGYPGYYRYSFPSNFEKKDAFLAKAVTGNYTVQNYNEVYTIIKNFYNSI